MDKQLFVRVAYPSFDNKTRTSSEIAQRIRESMAMGNTLLSSQNFTTTATASRSFSTV